MTRSKATIEHTWQLQGEEGEPDGVTHSSIMRVGNYEVCLSMWPQIEEDSVSDVHNPHLYFDLNAYTYHWISMRPVVHSSIEWQADFEVKVVVVKYDEDGERERSHGGQWIKFGSKTYSLGADWSSYRYFSVWDAHHRNIVAVKLQIEFQDCASSLSNWHAGGALCTMWNEMKFPDLSIIAEGEEILCHRSVLASASLVFDKMLSGELEEGHHSQIFLREVAPPIIRACLEYLYTGRLQFRADTPTGSADVESIAALLKLADMYVLTELANTCASSLVSAIAEENVSFVLKQLQLHHQASPEMQQYKDKAMDRVCQDRTLLQSLCFDSSPASVVQEDNHRQAIMVNVATQTSFGQTVDPESPKTTPAHGAICNDSAKAEEGIDSSKAEEDIDSPSQFQTAPSSSKNQAQTGCTSSVSVSTQEEHGFFKPSGCDLGMLRDTTSSHGIGGPPGLELSAAERSSDMGTKLHLLTFNRAPREFKDMLLQSPLAQQLTSDMMDVEPSWAKGATVLVRGLTEDMLQQTGVQCDSLRPWHVILHAEHENLVDEAVKSLKSRIRPRVKSSTIVSFGSQMYPSSKSPNPEENCESSQMFSKNSDAGEVAAKSLRDPDEGDVVIVDRTFISIVEAKEISPRTSYTKSSNDKCDIEHVGASRNPRQWG